MTDSAMSDRLAKVYLKIRDKRSALKREFEEQDNQLKEQQEKIRAALLDVCKQGNMKSFKTAHGATVIRTVKQKYWTSDWESMYKFIMDNNVPELLTRSIHQSNLKEFLSENPDKFPVGLNIDAEENISVRKPTAKAKEA